MKILFRAQACPRLWLWGLILIFSLITWSVIDQNFLHPYTIMTGPSGTLTWLTWKVMPPFLVIACLFSIWWAMASVMQNAKEQVLHQQHQQEIDQRAQADIVAASAKRHQQFSLEIRNIALTIDCFSQLAIWQQLDKLNHPLKSILSLNLDRPLNGYLRNIRYRIRAANAFKNVVQHWTKYWPLPTLTTDLDGMGPDTLFWIQNESGATLTPTTALSWHQGEGSDVLITHLFKAFDDNPDLPAVMVVALDRQPDSLDSSAQPENVGSTQPDAVVAMLFTRTDRTDQYIRPFTVDVPTNINQENVEYDVIKLWNYFCAQEKVFRNLPKNEDVMPTAFWNERVKTLIEQVDPNGVQSKTPFWDNGHAGFQPSPWIPVCWTKWQLEDEYDRAPIIGHLHRPMEVDLAGKSQAAQVEAMQTAWHKALGTLPDGGTPVWLFYDTGTDGKHVIPFARAMAQDGIQKPLDISDAGHSYNLSERIGNTGAASPFVQLGLAAMRSYEKGGISATVNLRQPNRASIIMLTPPTQQEKANNKPNPDNP